MLLGTYCGCTYHGQVTRLLKTLTNAQEKATSGAHSASASTAASTSASAAASGFGFDVSLGLVLPPRAAPPRLTNPLPGFPSSRLVSFCGGLRWHLIGHGGWRRGGRVACPLVCIFPPHQPPAHPLPATHPLPPQVREHVNSIEDVQAAPTQACRRVLIQCMDLND